MIALRGVVKHAGKSVSVAVRARVCDLLKNFTDHEDDQVRISAASILGITSEVCDKINHFNLYSVSIVNYYDFIILSPSFSFFKLLLFNSTLRTSCWQSY